MNSNTTIFKKKNLLMVSSGFPGPNSIAHTFVKGQVDYLKHYFNEIYVIAAIPYIPRFFSRFKLKSKWLNKVLVKNYNYDNVKVYYCRYIYFPAKMLEPLRSKLAYKTTIKQINSENLNFSLIHAQFLHVGAGVAYKLSKRFNKPYLLTLQENSHWLYSSLKNPLTIYLNALQSAKQIIRVNKKDVNYLKKFNKNVCSIPNGFDRTKFFVMDKNECRIKLKLPLDIFIIINVGFYHHRKGQKYLIEAIKMLPEKLKQKVICYIIGGGELHSVLQYLIDSYGLNENIKILGQIDHNDLPLWFNSSNIFAFPTLSEGNPTVMFEALGCGIPVIGSDVDGIPEVITNDKLGTLSEPKDSKQLSVNIEKAMTREWDTNYISDFAQKFTWENIAEKIVSEYEKIIV